MISSVTHDISRSSLPRILESSNPVRELGDYSSKHGSQPAKKQIFGRWKRSKESLERKKLEEEIGQIGMLHFSSHGPMKTSQGLEALKCRASGPVRGYG